ncbi:MAG: metal-dependent hydrolase [Ignavibacteriales bacterium]
MFVGHYSAALAAKAAEPRAPLWTLVGACQLMDIAWSALVMAGVEKLRIDPSLPGSSLDLYYMPFTHSLPGAIAWSVLGLVLARWLLKLPFRVAFLIGLTVFSHWVLDYLVHRPDLLLWPGDGKVGLGWWNYPVPEQALEIGLLGLGAMWWAWTRGRENRGLFLAALFTAALVGLQVAVMFMPAATQGGTFQFGLNALVVYLVVTAVAWLIDRQPVKKGSRRR